MYFSILKLSLFALVAGVYSAPTLCGGAIPDPGDFSELQRAANLSSAAYAACLGSAFDVTITKQLNDTRTDTQGFIGYSKTKRRISVVMRGSTTAKDFWNDADTTLTTVKLSGVNFPSDVRIMQGLTLTWGSVHDEVISEVKSLIEQFPDYTLETTGHSLGGSLTYMSYIALAQNFPEKNITSNALAAYPIGNEAFAKFGSSQHGLLRRGTNVNDGVPNLYVSPPWNFKHYGEEIYSHGTAATCVLCDGERDPNCSAGDGDVGVTAGHFYSFGVELGFAGCGNS